MKQIYYTNPDVTTTTTTTSAALAYGNTEITVADTSSFSDNDYVLIEEQGNEYNELLQISSVDSATQITVTSGIQYPHISGIMITKLSYDQCKITKSTDNTTYTTLVTQDLDYSNKYNRIEYYDDMGLDSYYYKIYYYNSTTLTETLAATLNDEDNFSWITLAKFHDQSGLSATYSSYVEEALRAGVEAMRDDLFFERQLETSDADTEFVLDTDGFFLADFNADRIIDTDDIIVYEWDAENNLATYLHHKLVKVFSDQPKIVFSESVPSSGKTLVIKVNLAQVPYENYKRSYEQINKLYAINYLLSDTVNDTVKNTILNWTAGGTTVSRDASATKDIIDKNKEQIKDLMKGLMLKTYMVPTKLRTRASSLNVRSRSVGTNKGNFTTASGNMYFY